MREQVADFVDEKRSQIGDSINEGRQAAEQARAEMLNEFEAEARAEG
jgi:hypothetical protein